MALMMVCPLPLPSPLPSPIRWERENFRQSVVKSDGSLLIDQAAGYPAIGINAPIAQKGPMRARYIDLIEMDGANENLLLLRAGFGEQLARSAGDKTLAPEFKAITTDRRFQPDAISHGDIATIGYCMAALDGFPGAMLRWPFLSPLLWMPADSRGIK